jgi:uncharacterized protein YvpB
MKGRLVIAAAGLLVAACGTTSSPTTGGAAATVTAIPTADAPTLAELVGIGEHVFIPAPTGGGYVDCSGGGGDFSGCPVTYRLATDLQRAGLTLCRCQNASDTRQISAEVVPGGGVVHVALFRGTLRLDLGVGRHDGRWLVDAEHVVAVPPVQVPAAGTTPTSPPAPPPLQARSIPTPAIRQLHPLDCEAAALQAALAARGTQVTQDWILAQMGADRRPALTDGQGAVLRWGNPYTAFVGDVDGSEPRATGYGVYWPPIAAAAKAAGRTAVGGEGWKAADIYAHLSAGHPVVIWTDTTYTPVPMHVWTAWDGTQVRYAIGEHAVTLTGIDPAAQTVQLLDVESGSFRTFSMSTFEAFWSSFDNMAVVVE